MSARTTDENQAVKYLLGELPEEELTQLEERFFNDPELSDLISEAEDDLIDQYVREELSVDERESFERSFLISERRQQKLEFARSLLQVELASRVSENAAATVDRVESPPVLRGALAALKSGFYLRPGFAYALAAVALIAFVGAAWLVVEMRDLRRQVAQIQAEREASELHNQKLAEEAGNQRRTADELAAEKQRLEAEIAELQRQPDAAGIVKAQPGVASLLALVLSPGARGGDATKTLSVTLAASQVRLQLELNPADRYPSYQVTLQTAAGQVVRRWTGLKSNAGAGKRSVVVTAPAASLSTGRYELVLSGVSASDHVETLGYYYFQTRRE